MHSFIVRVYRRRGGELSGTVQAVGVAAGPAAAFGSGGELLQQMNTAPRAPTKRSAVTDPSGPSQPPKRAKPGR
jgi:hypothetical protein